MYCRIIQGKLTSMKNFDKPQDKITYPVNPLIAKRWSPRAFENKDLPDQELNSLWEAIRWSASSMNAQPWQILFAKKGEEAHAKIVDTLMDGNKPWAANAPVLMVALAKNKFDNGKENKGAKYDLGLAIGNMSLQATDMGIALHQMGGFFPEKVSALFNLTDNLDPVAVLALGYYGDPESLEEPFKSREYAKRTRKEISEFVFHGELDPK